MWRRGGLKNPLKKTQKTLNKKKSKNGMRLRLQALRKKGGFDKHKKNHFGKCGGRFWAGSNINILGTAYTLLDFKLISKELHVIFRLH